MQDLFDQAMTVLERLKHILNDEAERLQQRNIDGLDELLADKLAALQAAELAERQRQELLVAAGYSADDAGMRRYLAEHSDAALSERWQAILASLQQVQILNEANGRIIHRGLDQVSQMLTLLRGDDSRNTGLYGPTGQTTRSGGKSLSHA